MLTSRLVALSKTESSIGGFAKASSITRGRISTSVTLVICAAILAGLTAAECHLAAVKLYHPASWTPSLVYGCVLWLWWAAIALLLWRLGKRWPGLWTISLRTVPAQFVVAGLLALFHGELLTVTVHLLMRKWTYLSTIGYRTLDFLGLDHVGLDILLYSVAWAATAAIYTQMERKDEEISTATLKQELAAAQLHVLQMQMEPHFLFNTLNGITALVEIGRREQATTMLRNLNVLLKSTLSQSVSMKVPLEDELRLLQSYLAIEQVRFADRLRVELSVDPDALEGLIPSFLLQPILENSIRHGISHLRDAGVIQTSVKRDGDSLYLTIRDNGPGQSGVKSSEGHGIGLSNTAKRLAQLYPGSHSIDWGNASIGGFEVSITIPFEMAGI